MWHTSSQRKAYPFVTCCAHWWCRITSPRKHKHAHSHMMLTVTDNRPIHTCTHKNTHAFCLLWQKKHAHSHRMLTVTKKTCTFTHAAYCDKQRAHHTYTQTHTLPHTCCLLWQKNMHTHTCCLLWQRKHAHSHTDTHTLTRFSYCGKKSAYSHSTTQTNNNTA